MLECLARQAGLDRDPQPAHARGLGPGRSDDTRNLRVCIRNLRQKLEPDPRQPRYLLTETGIGYRLMPDEEPA